MKRKTYLAITTLLVSAVLLVGGCIEAETVPLTTEPGAAATVAMAAGSGMLKVYVTDPPPPDMKEIWVDVKDLDVHRSDGEWETIAVDTEPFDLKAIEGIQDFLAEQIVGAGTYTQVRFEVNSVTVVTDDDVEHDAKVPSGKIKLVGTFEVVGGESTEITLDFNGKKSVVVTGNGEYIFKPVIKLLVADRGRPNELNELEGALGTSDNATAALSEDEYHAGSPSVHLATTGGQGTGDEARIVVELPKDTTLGDIESISWWEHLVNGYPPHVDIVMDVGGGEDRLVLEYAYNDHYAEGGPSYGALLGAWYQTFGDDAQGPTAIGDSALGWLASGPLAA